MKKLLLLPLLLILFIISLNNANSQTTKYTYTRPSWTIGIGPVWNLATNDAYGRANYASKDQILRDNYGMRWGYGAYVFVKYGPGKKKNDRIFLGFDYKGMKNADMDSEANETSYDVVTIDGGYEYLFYGTYGFRSYYGIGLTGNIISGTYTPIQTTDTARSFASTFRLGMELKAGLEFILNTTKKNIGINLGARYNLMNLFTDENEPIVKGTEENLNDGELAPGPGFKRYIGIVSIDVGLNIYPDVKRKVRK